MNALNILIVEDSRSLRAVLSKMLKKIGANVTTAKNGQLGFEKALEEEFDLILSDVEMPVMTGLELCENLKGNIKTRAIPVVLLSSMESEKDIDNGFRVGASAYIPKSASEPLLLSTIDEVLNKSLFQRNNTILVVDDSRTVLKLVESNLSKAGFQVITALNGKIALNLLKNQKPDLIISDLDMPVMNGFELCDNVKRDHKLTSIPFLVMSANNDRASMRSMIERGAAAYMVKPFNMEQLVITVEKLLSDQFKLILGERQRLESERKAMLGSITSLAHALEARDAYTRGHSEGVGRIVEGIGKAMNLPKIEIEYLRIGAGLHDIGKIGIPDGLLLKNGKLSKTETRIFQQHPEIGANILKPISSLRDVLMIVLHHHEQYDGSGYPAKLKGEKIPLQARITAVADTYDALTTDRPYRKGFPGEVAIKIIKEIRGTQLCPQCVDAFITWIE
ncbi:response regulator [bacterium]|nr:response regulator [bacterium]